MISGTHNFLNVFTILPFDHFNHNRHSMTFNSWKLNLNHDHLPIILSIPNKHLFDSFWLLCFVSMQVWCLFFLCSILVFLSRANRIFLSESLVYTGFDWNFSWFFTLLMSFFHFRGCNLLWLSFLINSNVTRLYFFYVYWKENLIIA